MKLRLLALLIIALATMTALAVPAEASASTSHQPRLSAAHHAARPAERGPDQTSFQTFCQSSNLEECLNQTNCNTSKGVQLWNVLTGGACSSDWFIAPAETVDPADTYPFYCGSGLNSAYEGDTVYSILYDPGSTIYAPTSKGYNDTVTLEPWDGTNDEGLFVAQDNVSGPTRLIDVTATCNDTMGGQHFVQHLYAGCGGSGCLVRDGENPSTGNTWDRESETQP